MYLGGCKNGRGFEGGWQCGRVFEGGGGGGQTCTIVSLDLPALGRPLLLPVLTRFLALACPPPAGVQVSKPSTCRAYEAVGGDSLSTIATMVRPCMCWAVCWREHVCMDPLRVLPQGICSSPPALHLFPCMPLPAAPPACLSCLQFQTSVQALLISNPELADNPTLGPGAIVKLPPA